MRIKSQITEKELYHFLMKHTYSSAGGFAGILISLCALFAFVQMWLAHGNVLIQICLLITALLFLAVQPVRLYLRAARLMQEDAGYKMPTEYVFDHNGMQITRGEDEATYTWAQVKKIISTQKIVAIYVDNGVVLKIARREMEAEYQEFCELVRRSVVHATVLLKK